MKRESCKNCRFKNKDIEQKPCCYCKMSGKYWTKDAPCYGILVHYEKTTGTQTEIYNYMPYAFNIRRDVYEGKYIDMICLIFVDDRKVIESRYDVLQIIKI